MSSRLDKKLLPAAAEQESASPTAANFTSFKWSCYLLGLINMMDAVEYGLVMPSLFLYLQEVVGEDAANLHFLYGAVISTFSVSSILFTPILGYWSDKRQFREVYVFSLVIAIAGSVLYSMAAWFGSIWIIVLGRFLGGLGAANTSLAFSYANRVMPNDQIAKMQATLGFAFPLGLVSGPCTNIITHKAVFSIGSFRVSDTNSPGLLLAVILSILLLLVVCCFKDAPAYEQQQDDTDGQEGTACSALCHEVRRPAVFACFIVMFTYMFIVASTESVVAPVTTSVFGFTPLNNAYLYGGLACQQILINLIVRKLVTVIQEKHLVLASCCLFIAGTLNAAFIWNYDVHKMPVWKFVLGQFSMFVCLPLAFAPCRSLFAKLIAGSRQQGLLSAAIQTTASIGGVLGPLYMGVVLGSEQKGHPVQGPIARNMFYGYWGWMALFIPTLILVWYVFDVPNTSQPLRKALVTDTPDSAPHVLSPGSEEEADEFSFHRQDSFRVGATVNWRAPGWKPPPLLRRRTSSVASMGSFRMPSYGQFIPDLPTQ